MEKVTWKWSHDAFVLNRAEGIGAELGNNDKVWMIHPTLGFLSTVWKDHADLSSLWVEEGGKKQSQIH